MKRFYKPKLYEVGKLEKRKINQIQSFKFEKLERGFAQTIGVALRRILLSSIPGVSCFAIEIEGAQHEFQSISNTKQDVVEIVLNVKNIAFKVDYNIIEPDEIYELTLSETKKGKIKAGAIVCPPGISVVNKSQDIAELINDSSFEMTFYVMLSRGYNTFEENRYELEELELNKSGVIPIDSNYSPVRQVKYNTSLVNPGERRVFERLIIEIETDGSVSPVEALLFSFELLKDYCLLGANEGSEDGKIHIEEYIQEEPTEEEADERLEKSIEVLNLSVRSENALINADIETIGDLVDRTVSELSNIKNLGEKSKIEIIQKLSNKRLNFKVEEDVPLT